MDSGKDEIEIVISIQIMREKKKKLLDIKKKENRI